MKKKYFLALATIALSITLSTNAMEKTAAEKTSSKPAEIKTNIIKNFKNLKEAFTQLQAFYSSKKFTTDETARLLIELMKSFDLKRDSALEFSEKEVSIFTDFILKLYIRTTVLSFLNEYEIFLKKLDNLKKPFSGLMKKEFDNKIRKSTKEKLFRLLCCCCYPKDID